jgi:hypothetical protein
MYTVGIRIYYLFARLKLEYARDGIATQAPKYHVYKEKKWKLKKKEKNEREKTKRRVFEERLSESDTVYTVRKLNIKERKVS